MAATKGADILSGTRIGDLTPFISDKMEAASLLYSTAWDAAGGPDLHAVIGSTGANNEGGRVFSLIEECGYPELVLEYNEYQGLAYQFLAHAHVAVVMQRDQRAAALDSDFAQEFRGRFGSWFVEAEPALRPYVNPEIGPQMRAFFGRGVFNPPEKAQPIGKLELRGGDGKFEEPMLRRGGDWVTAGFYAGQKGLAFAETDVHAPAMVELPGAALNDQDAFFFGQLDDYNDPVLYTWNGLDSSGAVPCSDDAAYSLHGDLAPDGTSAAVMRGAEKVFDIKWTADQRWFGLKGSHPEGSDLYLGLKGMVLPRTVGAATWRLQGLGPGMAKRPEADRVVREAWIDLSPDLSPVAAPLIPRRYSVVMRDGQAPYLYDWKNLKRCSRAQRDSQDLMPDQLGEEGFLRWETVDYGWPRWHTLVQRYSLDGHPDRMFGYVDLPREQHSCVSWGTDDTIVEERFPMTWLAESGGVYPLEPGHNLARWMLAGDRLLLSLLRGEALLLQSQSIGDNRAPSPVAAFVDDDGVPRALMPNQSVEITVGNEFIIGPYQFQLMAS